MKISRVVLVVIVSVLVRLKCWLCWCWVLVGIRCRVSSVVVLVSGMLIRKIEV